MSAATARHSSANSVVSKTARPTKARQAKAALLHSITQTFDMGDTHLQSVTEFWSGRPKGVESYEDPTRPGLFVATRLYCPFDRVFFDPSPATNPLAKSAN